VSTDRRMKFFGLALKKNFVRGVIELLGGVWSIPEAILQLARWVVWPGRYQEDQVEDFGRYNSIFGQLLIEVRLDVWSIPKAILQLARWVVWSGEVPGGPGCGFWCPQGGCNSIFGKLLIKVRLDVGSPLD